MKKKLTILKTVFLFLFAVFLLQGCREEINYVKNFSPPSPHQDGIAKNITFKQFRNETKINIKNIKQSLSRTSKNFKAQNYIDEFQVDTTFIKKLIYQTDKTSFTIRAFKRGENPKNITYNIVYHKVNDSWKAEIFKYTYDEKFLKDYNENALIPFSGKIQHLRTENVAAKTSEIYQCEYAVVPLCYCADHTTLMCNGCGQGFRDVGVWICKPAEENGGGTVNPYEPKISWPPFNDTSGGGAMGDNPYDIEFQNSLPVYDDQAYLENTWKYNLWNSLGNAYIYDPGLYQKFEEFQVLTKGRRIQDLINLSSFVQSQNQFAHFAVDFLISNTKNGICSVSIEQFERWFINGYSPQYLDNLTKLTSAQLQDFVSINKEIDASPYEEEFVKEANEEFVAFATLGDIDNLTVDKVKTMLAFLYPQFYQSAQRAKLINANYQFNRNFYPEWSKARCLWEASRESIQSMLDLAGLIPVIGEACDLTNGVIYTIQGDKLNAGLSYASAIPIAGWFASGVKIAGKVVNKAASHIASRQVLKWIVGTDGIIKFGYRIQLRYVLQLTDGAKQAHHIIPWEFSNYAIVQKAAKSSEAFHMNDVLNGVPLPTTGHLTGHNLYNDKVKDVLNSLNNGNPNAEVSYQRLMDFNNYLRNLIKNNPNLNLGQIANLIKYP